MILTIKKKNLRILLITMFLVVLIAPQITLAEAFDPAQGLVTCGNADDGSDACTICDFFDTLAKIYDFLVKWIAAPLAVVAISVGAVFMLIGGSSPNLYDTGKKIVRTAIIGLFLVFASWLIIDLILHAVGYSNADNWWQLNITCPPPDTGSGGGSPPPPSVTPAPPSVTPTPPSVTPTPPAVTPAP